MRRCDICFSEVERIFDLIQLSDSWNVVKGVSDVCQDCNKDLREMDYALHEKERWLCLSFRSRFIPNVIQSLIERHQKDPHDAE